MIKRVHFIGICGTGMSAVAKMLLDQGWEVTGSDEGFYPPVSDMLTRYGIPCLSPYAARNIPSQVDRIVIGKHSTLTPEENEEVKEAFARGVPVQSYPDVLEELTRGKESLVVAGSYGKSSCTALLAWILTHAKKDPSYFIGAAAKNFEDGGHIGGGPAFVLEGDEYPSANWDASSKFLHYNAKTLLLTSCEHDHVNVFPTLEEYLVPFRQLVQQIPTEGCIIACEDGQNVAEVLKGINNTPVVWYCLNGGVEKWGARDIRLGDMTRFTLTFNNEAVCEIASPLLGEHNVQNAVGVAALLLHTGMCTSEEVVAGMASFAGVKRRLELKTAGTSIPVYEDFGSSRAKALAGIHTVRNQFPDKRLIVVFEPHTFSFRNREALSWYDDLFMDADMVYVFQPPTHGAATHTQLTQEEIVARINASGVNAYAAQSGDQLVRLLTDELKASEDVVLIESSGALDGAIPKITQLVQERFIG